MLYEQFIIYLKNIMKTNKTEHEGISAKTIFSIGAGVAALATASYYFFGPDGKVRREKMKDWMVDMKGQILEKAQDVKDLTQPVYNEIVDSVVATYETAKVSKDELKDFASSLKDQWKEIKASMKEKADEVMDEAEDVKDSAKKAVHKAANKVAKKTE